MKKISRLGRKMRKDWQIYVFLLLPLTYLILFHYVPMFGIQIAFKKFNPMKGIWGSPWVGLQHFRKFFRSYYFERVTVNTLRLSLYSLIVGFPIPILFALLLNAVPGRYFKKTVQTVTYMPHFISIVVLVGMIQQMFSPSVGLYYYAYKLFGGQGMPTDILAQPNSFIHMYVWSGIWQSFGWNSIIYVAALAGVPQDLHEAAEIDGATRFQRILHIDLPSIIPTATIMLILRFGQVMSIGYEKVYRMQNTMNQRTSEVISTYVYKIGLGAGGNSDYSLSTAVGLFNSVINLALITTFNKISKRLGDTSLW